MTAPRLTKHQRAALDVLREHPQHAHSPAWLATKMTARLATTVRAVGAARAAERLVLVGLAERADHPYAQIGYRVTAIESPSGWVGL